MSPTKTGETARIRGVPQRIPGYGPDDFEPQVDVVQVGALRVVGVPHLGFLDAAALEKGFADLDKGLDASKVTPDGSAFVLLADDPFTVNPPKRKYLFVRPVRGPATVAEGVQRLIADGGSFVRLRLPHGLLEMESAVGFVFGKWLVERSFQLARPAIRLRWDGDAPPEQPARAPIWMEIPTVIRMVHGPGMEGEGAG